MNRAKVIALRHVPKADPVSESLQADIAMLKDAVAGIKPQVTDLSPVLSQLKGMNTDSLVAAIQGIEKTVADLGKRVAQIEQRQTVKRKLAFDVVTDAAGEIRQIIAKEM